MDTLFELIYSSNSKMLLKAGAFPNFFSPNNPYAPKLINLRANNFEE